MGEVIFTDGTEDLAPRQMIEGYLAHKWSLVGRLPADHLYKSAPPAGTQEAATTLLDGTVTDAEGYPLTTTWTLVSGPALAFIADSAAVDTAVTFPMVGDYTFRLTANDGVTESNDTCVITVVEGIPPAPTGLSATAVSGSQIDLSWTDTSTTESGFWVERSLTSGSNFMVIGSAVANATNYTDSTVAPATTYYYRVTATNAEFVGIVSTEASATTPKLMATVTLGNLSQTYDGTARTVTTTTEPTNLMVVVTYDGSGATPTNAGSYAVVATISETLYQGSTNGTLVVGQATPTVTNWPTASAISLGQAVSNAVLTGGSASVPGSFGFTAPATVPPTEGVYTAAVTFVATDSVNYAPVNGEVAVTINPPLPQAPTGLSAIPTLTQVSLDWTAVQYATSYNVKRAATPGGPYATIATVSTTNQVDTAVTNGVTYYYVVSAVNTSGEGSDSAEVSATLPKLPATVTLSGVAQTYDGTERIVTADTEPTGLDVLVTYNGNVIAPTNAGSYAVTGMVVSATYAGTTNGILVVAQLIPTVTNWPTASSILLGQAVSNAVLTGGSASVPGSFGFTAPDTVPPAEGAYTAAVTFVATDSVNYASVNGEVPVTVNPPIPSAPTGLTQTATPSQVGLVWSASLYATSYNVKRSDSLGGPYVTIGTSGTTNFVDTAVTNGVTYYYVVTAVGVSGEGSASSEVNALIPYGLPFAENFEARNEGELNGQNGWLAQSAVVQTATKIGTKAASISASEGYVKHDFVDLKTQTWTDFMIQPVFYSTAAALPETTGTAMFYFNAAGNAVVYNGSTTQTVSHAAITQGEWVRVTVRSDYVAKKWDLYINTVKVATGLDFYNQATTGYSWIKISGAGATSVALDELTIGLQAPWPSKGTLIKFHF